ncbi:HAMP domain-containing protein [Clostridium bovifaecis]|uniref:HAMP domain-containing protein n=1 Tax=Clostridium bovifaecis TaxID=2184719 RepID=A0A6I6F1J9_9CLOT|nr:HAMP domain-containing protein [Clostridium bovifaecis]
MFKSLKNKIVSGFIAVTLITMIALTGLGVYGVSKALSRQMDNASKLIAATAKQTIDEYSIGNIDEIDKELERVQKDSNEEVKYIFVVDKNNKIIASSSDNNGIAGNIPQEDFDKTMKGEVIGEIIKNDGQLVYNVLTPFYNKDTNEITGAISIGISIPDMTGTLKAYVKDTIILALVILAIAIITGYIISMNIVKPINTISKKMENVVQGDFTIEFHPKKQDEIGALMISLNYVISTLREIIEKIQGTAMKLDEMSRNLSTSSEEVAATSLEITNSIDEIAKNSSDQSISMGNTTEYIGNFSKHIDVIHNKIEKVAASSRNIEQAAHLGEKELETFVLVIDDMKEAFARSAEKIDFLNNNVGKITEVMDVINAVAEQTNLLALNAAIEAARAGESGRGFAVVAEEIRKLAEQVLQSSKSITDLVQTVMMNTKEVSETTDLVSDKMRTEMKTVDGTVVSIKNILNEIEAIMPHIDKVYDAVDRSMEEKDKVIESVQGVNGRSQQLAANTEEISASIQTQEELVEEFAASSGELSLIASEFAEKVSKFKIK